MSESKTILLDIGNTRLKWGVLSDGCISRTGSIDHVTLQEKGFAALTTRLPTKVDHVIASNVAGATFATRLSGVVGIHCNCVIQYVRSERSGFGLTNGYTNPRQFGVDRWVAMVGARAEFETALCVVDAGTAVTIDAIEKSGRHLGGLIVPGVDLIGSGFLKNANITPVPKKHPRMPATGLGIFAKNTHSAVYNGALSAACGAIEHSVRALRSGGQRPKIVLTGGDASRILKQIEGKFIHRPHLVLQGLAHMAQNES